MQIGSDKRPCAAIGGRDVKAHAQNIAGYRLSVARQLGGAGRSSTGKNGHHHCSVCATIISKEWETIQR